MEKQNTRQRTDRNTGTSRKGLMEKYRQHLAFAALKISAGDRVGAENDYQHAEHFYRSAAEYTEPDRN
ncbi:DUF4167 domain-containing protein [Martelella soudanensis]|uniref:DUF4167 domain-containing protein n=1 Tax=unclassified Martelella TaxID=2629616 RepID=UPI0015DEB246|nr:MULTISPECIES: DUF4167 domain-containing protein [unclassified Martelella]